MAYGCQLQLTHADPHHRGALKTIKAVALEVARAVQTCAIATHIVGDLALVNICKVNHQVSSMCEAIGDHKFIKYLHYSS